MLFGCVYARSFVRAYDFLALFGPGQWANIPRNIKQVMFYDYYYFNLSIITLTKYGVEKHILDHATTYDIFLNSCVIEEKANQ